MLEACSRLSAICWLHLRSCYVHESCCQPYNGLGLSDSCPVGVSGHPCILLYWAGTLLSRGQRRSCQGAYPDNTPQRLHFYGHRPEELILHPCVGKHVFRGDLVCIWLWEQACSLYDEPCITA